MGQRGDQTCEEVKAQVAEEAEAILDVVAEDPQEQHVAPEMHQAAVEEHGEQDRKENGLVRKDWIILNRGFAGGDVQEAGIEGQCELFGRQRPARCDLTGNRRVFEVEPCNRRIHISRGVLVEQLQALRLDEEIHGDVEGDQHECDNRCPARGVVVAQGNHVPDRSVRAPKMTPRADAGGPNIRTVR